MTFHELEEQLNNDFCACGIENSRAEVSAVVSESLKISNSEYLCCKIMEKEISPEDLETVMRFVKRRLKHEPLQYITGTAYFRELVFEVNPDVLIPRFETELLVDEIVKNAPENARILDIGTGSGAIAVSCAFERKDCRIVAVDISRQALKTAEKNAEKQNLYNIRFVESDLFSGIEPDSRFDVIAANLPYVTNSEYQELAPEVRLYEPRLALTADEDGLCLIYKVCRELDKYLASGGFAIFEMSPFQTQKVKELLTELGFSAGIIKDCTGRARFVKAFKK